MDSAQRLYIRNVVTAHPLEASHTMMNIWLRAHGRVFATLRCAGVDDKPELGISTWAPPTIGSVLRSFVD
ncbi:hypothetical protein C0Z18_31135 [Trinickia dabaoshanensis]|uniref:Uncharacterized protein n=1 Tax=Trinickia dabaoshanensis TaxID=564714 RepID=A0A2N7VBR6_9BURK|nr:hypothetical protein C0Z18_31135 [Trinickia dabaoshanensis]